MEIDKFQAHAAHHAIAREMAKQIMVAREEIEAVAKAQDAFREAKWALEECVRQAAQKSLLQMRERQ